MLAIRWAREKNIPFLGICLGFQLAVIEFARNVCSFTGKPPSMLVTSSMYFAYANARSTGATSTEFDEKTPQPIIIFMPEISKTHMGGTMRLGLRPTVFQPGSENWSKMRKLYGGAEKIWERHRHRYEVNPEYIEKLTASGLSFVGRDERGERMQILELQGT